MKNALLRPVIALSLALIGIALPNASRWAPEPTGEATSIAHRGVHHLHDPTGTGRDDCTAIRLLSDQEDRMIFENTVDSIRAAVRLGADMIEVDVAPTADGRMVLFHDWTVDCRTDGTGETRELTLAALRALDIGHGYSADGGRTFAWRGRGVGQMPTVAEAIASGTDTSFLFNFKSRDADEADRLLAVLEAAGRDPLAAGDGFYGADAPVERVAASIPGAWAWSVSSAKTCTTDYVLAGWFGRTPESCRNGTLIVPLNYRWAFAGWPNRTLARLRAVGGRVLLTGPYVRDDAARGLTRAEQLNDVPPGFDGYLMIEDITEVGPALGEYAARGSPIEEYPDLGESVR